MANEISLLPDSAYSFWWVKVPTKKGNMVLGAGLMEGIVCTENELHEWVSQQFRMESKERGGKCTTFRKQRMSMPKGGV